MDMSPPLVEEGKNYTKSTNWKSISIKHNNGESTMLDLVVVQAMSRKIVQTLPSIMQLHCPTSLVMSKRWEHVYNNHYKMYVCNA